MNFHFAEQLDPFLEKYEFSKAISIAEEALEKIPPTEFHYILGRSLISQTEILTDWVNDFYETALKKGVVKALYFEINEFDINLDTWYIDGFAYDKDEGLDLYNMDWLCDYIPKTAPETDFVLTGYEKLQDAFGNINNSIPSNNTKMARDWCEQIIIVRFMELMRTSHLLAKEKHLGWAGVPIYFTEHSYDFILLSMN